jgi:hypothetical protein
LELVTNKALYFVFKKSAPFINILKKWYILVSFLFF